ncbi:MAG: nicotinate (nicotinamide) nucleotide adenylyltransferase [Chitinispirillaceae bacterium]|nr:nicotinate (nicotinamide) nucleotide adenylyltransferase [Chitinispirillaceae bacterium]
MTVPVGVLGGIFDPVHFGHLATASLACEFFHLEKIYFVPAGIPPHKLTTVTASASDRLAMLRLALEGEQGAAIWDSEIRRREVSYTVDTLAELRETVSDASLFFIVGADNLHEIHTWHRYRDILATVTLCVAERPGYTMEIPESLAGARIQAFPSPLWGLSSTQLRRYISTGYQCRYLLPDRVREYIFTRGLYRTCDDRTGTVQCRQAH